MKSILLFIILFWVNAKLSNYEHDVIQSLTSYPRSSKLFSDLGEWQTVPTFCYDPEQRDSFSNDAVQQALEDLEKRNIDGNIQMASRLILESFIRVYDEKSVSQFDAIVLEHAEIPLFRIQQCIIPNLKESIRRSMVIDYQKIITLLDIQDPSTQREHMSSRALSMKIEGWILTVMVGLVAIVLIGACITGICDKISSWKKNN